MLKYLYDSSQIVIPGCTFHNYMIHKVPGFQEVLEPIHLEGCSVYLHSDLAYIQRWVTCSHNRLP